MPDFVGCCWILLDVVSQDAVGLCLVGVGCYWALLDVAVCCFVGVVGCCWMLLGASVAGIRWMLQLRVVGQLWEF